MNRLRPGGVHDKNVMYFPVLLANELYCIQKHNIALYNTVLFQQQSPVLKEQYFPLLQGG